LYDSPNNFNILLQFFKITNNQGTFLWNASQQHPHTNQPKHTFWEEFMVDFETLKFFIIPFINYQHQPLDKKFTPSSTLENGFSYTSVGNKDLIETSLFWKPKPHYLFALLLILPPLHHEIFAKCTSFGNSFATQSSCV